MIHEKPLVVETVVVHFFQVNCSVAYDRNTRDCYIFDPGGHHGRVISKIQDLKLKPKAIIQTHGHLDHVQEAGLLQKALGVPAYAHVNDEFLYANVRVQAQMFGMDLDGPPLAIERYVEDGDEFELTSDVKFRAICTPGHTPGGVSYFSEDSDPPTVIVGDTLFLRSVGRTDLPGGDFGTLEHSVRDRLYKLPKETVVYTGHGVTTTIGFERENNMFIRAV
ncbi:MAG: MBL fold metallo-hydrolase [Planctomycetes bacterium]|nr:MBL fold metallo-hydrolase [Planctomycetota bacterium]